MIAPARSLTVGELRKLLGDFPDDAVVEIMASTEWKIVLQGVAGDRPKDGRFQRVLLLSAAAMPRPVRSRVIG